MPIVPCYSFRVLSIFIPYPSHVHPPISFHRALIACSSEIVLASHRASAHMFPAILEPAGVSAFDMDKVMEGVVR